VILGQAFSYTRRRTVFTAADCWGAAVVHHDLLKAALRYGAVDEVHLFTEMPSTYTSGGVDLKAVQELREDAGADKVQIKGLEELPALCETNPYVLIADIGNFGSLGLARRYNGGRGYPICCVVHAVSGPAALPQYLSMLLLERPFDSLVVTSTAARRALDEMFALTSDLLGNGSILGPGRQIPVARLPLAVDASFLHPVDRIACRNIFDIDPGAVVLLYLGRLSADYKADLEPLIRAFGELKKNNARLLLLVAGWDAQDSYRDTLENVARSVGVGSSLRIISNFPYFAKPLLYSASDVFISPVDNIQETFGLSVLEAMACGLPVVVSDWSGYRDLVEHGRTGFLVPTLWNTDAGLQCSKAAALWRPPGAERYLAERTVVDCNALTHYLKLLIDDRNLRGSMGDSAQRHVRANFSWEVVTKQFRDLWTNQLEQMAHQADAPTATRKLDLNAVYGHFASDQINRQRVSIAPAGLQLLASALAGHAARWPAWSSPQQMQGILEACREQPCTVADLAGKHGPCSDTVSWLLKKGCLQIV
jgi:D-inositol-3-phosphate glycosyltransferase